MSKSPCSTSRLVLTLLVSLVVAGPVGAEGAGADEAPAASAGTRIPRLDPRLIDRLERQARRHAESEIGPGADAEALAATAPATP